MINDLMNSLDFVKIIVVNIYLNVNDLGIFRYFYATFTKFYSFDHYCTVKTKIKKYVLLAQTLIKIIYIVNILCSFNLPI